MTYFIKLQYYVDHSKEIWKEILEYPEHYISSFDNLKRIKYTTSTVGDFTYHYKEELTIPTKQKGYLQVHLINSLGRKVFSREAARQHNLTVKQIVTSCKSRNTILFGTRFISAK